MTTAETIHPETPTSDSPPLASIMDIPKSGHPRNGKIAKLPKELRALINQMLSEQAASAVIIEQFAQRGISLNHENVSNWRTGGHQDWLQHQAWLAEIAAEHESASDLFNTTDDSKFHQVVIQVAIIQIFQALKKGKLNDDPANYTRLLNSLARLIREALGLRKYDHVIAETQAQEIKKLDPNRELNEQERLGFFNAVQRLFGFKPDRPIGPPLAEIMAKMHAAQNGVPATAPGSAINPAPSGTKTEDPTGVLPAKDSPEVPPADIGAPVSVPNSEIKIQKSKFQNPADDCHHCRKPLPPLLPNGARPFTHCKSCGAVLRAPGALLEFCPCGGCCMPELLPNGRRPTQDCKRCGKSLPPPKPINSA